jgi:hypothetical protein
VLAFTHTLRGTMYVNCESESVGRYSSIVIRRYEGVYGSTRGGRRSRSYCRYRYRSYYKERKEGSREMKGSGIGVGYYGVSVFR